MLQYMQRVYDTLVIIKQQSYDTPKEAHNKRSFGQKCCDELRGKNAQKGYSRGTQAANMAKIPAAAT